MGAFHCCYMSGLPAVIILEIILEMTTTLFGIMSWISDKKEEHSEKRDKVDQKL